MAPSEYIPQLQVLPSDVPSLLRIANGLLEQKLPDDVAIACARALALDPHCAQAYFLLARAQQQQRRLGEAREHAARAVEIEPQFTEALVLQSRLSLELSEAETALAQAQQAVRLDAQAHAAWALAGAAHLQLEQANKARKAFRRATGLADDQWGYWYGLGAAEQALGRHKTAVQAFYRVLDFQPRLPHAHYQLGCLFLELERDDEARLAFEVAAECNPVRDLLQLVRVMTLLARHDHAGARAVLAELQAAMPQVGLVPLLLGEVELRETHDDEALALFRAAGKLNPALAASYYKAGQSLRRLGQPWEAAFEWQEALRRNPQYAPAQIELEDLFFGDADTGLLEFDVPRS